MSHYTVAVFSNIPEDKAFDELLAPYDENIPNNPNAKYDYYSLGGKDYIFDPKPNQHMARGCFFYRKNQIDYSSSQECFSPEEAIRAWEFFVEEKEPKEGETKPFQFFSKEYYLEKYGTKEQFVSDMCECVPYAFVTPDGVWHSPGDMGWFAIDNSTIESNRKYRDEWHEWINSKDNPYVSFVDCHI